MRDQSDSLLPSPPQSLEKRNSSLGVDFFSRPANNDKKSARSNTHLPQWAVTSRDLVSGQRSLVDKIFRRRCNLCQFVLGILCGALLVLACSSQTSSDGWAKGLQYKLLRSQSKYYHRNDASLLVVPRRQPKIGIHSVFFGSGDRHTETKWLNVASPNTSRKAPPRDSPDYYAPVRLGEALDSSYTFTMDEIFRLSIGTMKRYAERWDYPFWLADHVIMSGPQFNFWTGMWSKEALTLSILLDEMRKPEGERLEWLFFCDADFVVVNQNIPLSTFLPPTRGPHAEEGKKQILLISNDRFNSINAGGYMIRVCEEGIKLMLMLASMPLTSTRGFLEGEQTAITRTIGHDRFVDNVSLVPGHYFNANAFDFFAYPGWADEDKSFHMGDWSFHMFTEKRKGWDSLLRWVTSDKYDFVNSTFAVPLNNTRLMSGNDTVVDFYRRWFQLTRDERRHEIRKFKQD